MRKSLFIALILILMPIELARGSMPQVLITSPDNGENDVAADVSEIRIQFDQPMDHRGRSIVGGGDAFPQIAGELKWVEEKTLVMPVKLKPNHDYWFSINSDTFKGFSNKAGEPADWYPVRFHTRAENAAAAKPDVTLAQNKAALAELRRAVDEDYAYRDWLKIDWHQQIDASQAKFEKAATANEFARLTAHLLRQARDAHVSVQAGDVRIWTQSNSAPPNFNYQSLSKIVPGWIEHPSGIITGKFDDGVGYILFSACSEKQADGFDQALDDLKGAPVLIIDARGNGGGDETAAQRVAGRFVEKSAVYSMDRIREKGIWKGPFKRIVEPRKDAARYTKPVAVLIGPKVISSAESFVLMMKQGANATLVGSTTSGASGRPLPHDLGNGVTAYLSSWEDQLSDGTVLQGRGVTPDIAVKTTPRSFAQSDPVLDAALKSLR